MLIAKNERLLLRRHSWRGKPQPLKQSGRAMQNIGSGKNADALIGEAEGDTSIRLESKGENW